MIECAAHVPYHLSRISAPGGEHTSTCSQCATPLFQSVASRLAKSRRSFSCDEIYVTGEGRCVIFPLHGEFSQEFPYESRMANDLLICSER
jgi:hypothetical protein